MRCLALVLIALVAVGVAVYVLYKDRHKKRRRECSKDGWCDTNLAFATIREITSRLHTTLAHYRHKHSYTKHVSFRVLESNVGSHTADKHLIYIALRDLHTGSLCDLNTLMYVALHELGHVMCGEWDMHIDGHSKEFNDIFDRLIAIAVELRYYDRSKPIDAGCH